MDKSERTHYHIGNVWINGNAIHGLQRNKVKFVTTFELQQCFCSCSLQTNVHYDSCPNARKDRFIRYLTEEEKKKA